MYLYVANRGDGTLKAVGHKDQRCDQASKASCHISLCGHASDRGAQAEGEPRYSLGDKPRRAPDNRVRYLGIAKSIDSSIARNYPHVLYFY